MSPVAIIAKKRDGLRLSSEEIGAFVDGYVRGDIHDYQMAALAMAVYLRGMDPDETTALTQHMVESGATIQWSTTAARKVDKHSTGGIGDKVSLVLVPLLACCGLQVPMVSGRALGSTGGTLDKLESIAGFRTDLTLAEIREIVERVGCVITGASTELAPADRKLYALRDVTATVGSVPLITASILSKKLAENLSALVVDVKFGSGTFMKTEEQARGLARSLVDVAVGMGVNTTALLTDMNQPLGRMVGNAMEVNEAVDALSGRGPADLMTVVFELGVELLRMTGVAASDEDGRRVLADPIESGQGLEKFREMVAAQGGDLDSHRRVAPSSQLGSHRTGYVTRLDADKIGQAIVSLGGGRQAIGDAVDHAVGVEVLARVGDNLEKGEPWIRIFANQAKTDRVRPFLHEAICIGDTPPKPLRLIGGRLSAKEEKWPTRFASR